MWVILLDFIANSYSKDYQWVYSVKIYVVTKKNDLSSPLNKTTARSDRFCSPLSYTGDAVIQPSHTHVNQESKIYFV